MIASWLRALWAFLLESNRYSARKQRQEDAKRDMERALGWRR